MYQFIIFGTGQGSRQMTSLLDSEQVQVVAYADNDVSKQNSHVQGIPVIAPEQIPDFSFNFIAIGSMYEREIRCQLLQLGIPEVQILPFIREENIRTLPSVYDRVVNATGKLYLEMLRQRLCQRELLYKVETNALMLGKLNADRIGQKGKMVSLEEVEFRVFSQFGEDGIIQYIISKIPIPNRVFIEFGVENYQEANTRFLLLNNNWKGLVMDGFEDFIMDIKRDPIYYSHALTAETVFITRDNINEVIERAGISGDIGLLSVDIDGNDYWIWQAINVVSPRIVVCEYNGLFGSEHRVTVPYEETFQRTRVHYSNLYFGASLAALCSLADEKGYKFIGSNSAGNNAFFVRNDLVAPFRQFTPQDGFVECQVRESRDRYFNHTSLSGMDRLVEIQDCLVYDLLQKRNRKIADVFGLQETTVF